MNEIKIEYGSIYRRIDGEDVQVFCPFAPGCDANQERHEETAWCTTDCAAFRLTVEDRAEKLEAREYLRKFRRGTLPPKRLLALCQRMHGKQIIGILKQVGDDK
jgi:hypothetical protein